MASLTPPSSASAKMSPPNSTRRPGTSISVGELLDLLAVGGELLAGAVGEVDLARTRSSPLRAIWRAPVGGVRARRPRRRRSSARSRRTDPPSPAAPPGRRHPGSACEDDLRLHLAVAEARLLEQVERRLALGAGQLELGLERAAQAARQRERRDEQDDPADEHPTAAAVHVRASRCSMGGTSLSRGSSQVRRPFPPVHRGSQCPPCLGPTGDRPRTPSTMCTVRSP